MLNIRTAVDEDAAVVAALIRASFQKQAELLAINPQQYPNYVGFETEEGIRRRLAVGVQLLLAYERAEPIGTVSYAGDSGHGEITRLAVLPAHRGNGYGRELMSYAENRLLVTGAEVVELSLVAQFHRLQTFYEALGYVPCEVRRVRSLPFNILVMRKLLSNQSPPS